MATSGKTVILLSKSVSTMTFVAGAELLWKPWCTGTTNVRTTAGSRMRPWETAPTLSTEPFKEVLSKVPSGAGASFPCL
eukprot:8914670-Heterocapsa_arctica.AAC.1